MADDPIRVYGPAQPGTSDGTLYTVPGATTLIVRNIHICNTTGTAATIFLAINGTSDTAANCFLDGFSIPADGSHDWSGFLVVETGQTIQGKQGTASALTVTISGVNVT